MVRELLSIIASVVTLIFGGAIFAFIITSAYALAYILPIVGTVVFLFGFATLDISSIALGFISATVGYAYYRLLFKTDGKLKTASEIIISVKP